MLKNVIPTHKILYGYVVPSHIGTFAETTPQPKFTVYCEQQTYVILKYWQQ